MLHNKGRDKWNRWIGCAIGAQTQATLDGCNWSRSQKFYMVYPEIWVQVTQSLRGKRVILLWDERCLPYVHVISFFSWWSEGGEWGWRPWTPCILKFENIFVLVSSLWNKNLMVVCPLEICFWPPPVKIHYLSTGKIPSYDQVRLYVDQGFSNFFAHFPLSIRYITSRHLLSMLG